MQSLVKKVQMLWNVAGVQWIVKTSYYLLILLALLWMYGFRDTSASNFIYNDF